MIHLLLVASPENKTVLLDHMQSMGITVTHADDQEEAEILLEACSSGVLSDIHAVMVDDALERDVTTVLPFHLAAVDDLEAAGEFVSEVTNAFRAAQSAQTDPMLESLRVQWIARADKQRQEMEAIGLPLSEEEAAEVRRISHTIRGTAQSFGFPSLGILAAEVEEMIKRGDTGKSFAERKSRLEAELKRMVEDHE